MSWLNDHFKGRVITKELDFAWASHSPDLTPPDFFLWGYLKDRVYTSKPSTIPELKRLIDIHIKAIPREPCYQVIHNFKKRIDLCIDRNGAHLEHVI